MEVKQSFCNDFIELCEISNNLLWFRNPETIKPRFGRGQQAYCMTILKSLSDWNVVLKSLNIMTSCWIGKLLCRHREHFFHKVTEITFYGWWAPPISSNHSRWVKNTEFPVIFLFFPPTSHQSCCVRPRYRNNLITVPRCVQFWKHLDYKQETNTFVPMNNSYKWLNSTKKS